MKVSDIQGGNQMDKNILPHLYLLFGITFFILAEGVYGSAGYFGQWLFYGSIIMIVASTITLLVRARLRDRS